MTADHLFTVCTQFLKNFDNFTAIKHADILDIIETILGLNQDSIRNKLIQKFLIRWVRFYYENYFKPI